MGIGDWGLGPIPIKIIFKLNDTNKYLYLINIINNNILKFLSKISI